MHSSLAILLGLLLAASAIAGNQGGNPVPTPPAGPALAQADREKLAAVDWPAVRENAAAFLSSYIQVPSVSGSEQAAGDFLEKEARARGFRVERLDMPDGRPNVLISSGPAGTPGLILLSHIDVVPVRADEWTVPPFSGARQSGSVWGRGALDAKGQTVMHLGAMQLLAKLDPAYPKGVMLLAVSDEEAGGAGAAYVVSHFGDRFGKAPVLGEGGTGLRGGVDPVPASITLYPIATAEKSAVWVTLELDLPSSGHGSVPPEEYASRVMIGALNRLLDSKLPMRLVPETIAMLENLARYENFPKNLFMQHPDWRIVKPILDRALSTNPLTNALVRDTMTLTGIETAPGSGNTIPTRITARLDCRLLPGTNQDLFLKQMKDLLKEPRIQIHAHERSPGAPSSKPEAVYAALEATLKDHEKDALVTPFLFPASSDGNFFRAAGHPVMGFLPTRLEKAEIEAIHGKDERCREESLEDGIRTVTEVLLRLKGAAGF